MHGQGTAGGLPRRDGVPALPVARTFGRAAAERRSDGFARVVHDPGTRGEPEGKNEAGGGGFWFPFYFVLLGARAWVKLRHQSFIFVPVGLFDANLR